MKMVTLLKILLVVALAKSASSEGEETSTTTTTTTTTVLTPEANQDLGGVLTPVQAGSPARLSGVQKQFFYGRKFELPKDSRDKKDEFYSPLITSPIRTLPSLSEQNVETERDGQGVRHYQNEIFSNIRDIFQDTTKKTQYDKSQFSEKAKEEKSYGEEATTILNARENFYEQNSSSPSAKSRQEGDRSLLVVLPFRAEGDNVEELFTKSPLVKMIENDEKDEGQDTTSQPPFRREILPTTEQNPVTRKRWRPLKRDDTTGESPDLETTTESRDLTKNYTNYNDVELITKKYDAQVGEAQNLANHNFEADLHTPYPVYKRWRNKTKKEEPEVKDTTEDPKSPGKSENPRNSVETTEKLKPKVRGKGQRRKATTEGPPKPEELSKVLDVLPPDMKDLILHIGLNKEEGEQPSANESDFRLDRPPQPKIDPKSYAVFKPLPLDEQDEHRNVVPEDMKDFLASFGLLPLGRRVQKSLKPGVISSNGTETETETVEAMSDADLDFLPEELKSLLKSMGLTKNQDRKEPTRIHIFNPSNHSIAHSEEEFEKLNAILSSIKEAVNKSESLTADMQSKVVEKIRDLNNFRHQNGNLSAINDEIKKVAVNSQISANKKSKTTAKRATKLHIDGPDPLIFSEESLLKNDVKRQVQISSSSSSSSSLASSDSSSSSSSSSSLASSDSSSSSSSSSFSSSSSSSSSLTPSDSSSSSASASSAETTAEDSPNIEALKESFGGGETAPDDADIESSLPPKRPNGLYLLLDWNSFLEVGTEDDNRRVNLRFQPKIGDSRNFLPVSVP